MEPLRAVAALKGGMEAHGELWRVSSLVRSRNLIRIRDLIRIIRIKEKVGS
jgi:hypothetical protein